MQKLIQLLTNAASRPPMERWNLCREYAQVLVLKSLYASPRGAGLNFQGGTCLRMCHGTRRYSEDLDFSWGGGRRRFSLKEIMADVLRDALRRGFQAEGVAHDDKIVQKAFVKFSGWVERFKFPFPANQKLSVKIEVDTRPPPGGKSEVFFVSRFNELFPVRKHDLPTLFSGKMLALLFRPYCRGRDYFDLIWFLQNKVSLNLPYFRSGAEQHSAQKRYRHGHDILEAAREKVERVSVKALVEDVSPFLEDPEDLNWIKRLPAVFAQLAERYNKSTP